MRFNVHHKYHKMKADPFSQAAINAEWFRSVNDDDTQ